MLPPDVNRSQARFSVENGGIRFGLSAVRNVGSAAMEAMVVERAENGPYTDFFNFTQRVGGLNKRLLEGLICAGCFDSMGGTRAQYMAVYEQALDAANATRKTRETGQLSLFDLAGGAEALQQVSIKLPNVPDWKSQLKLARERDATGLYLSGHPLDHLGAAMKNLPNTVAQLMEADGITGVSDNANVIVGGLLTGCKPKPTKSGNGLMGYANLEGVTGSVECVLFPRTLQQYGSCFHDDAAVLAKGRLNIRDERANSLLIESLELLENVPTKTVYLKFDMLTESTLSSVSAFLSKYPGTTPVVLFDAAKRIGKSVPKNLYVNPTQAFAAEAEHTFGKDHVVIK